MTSPAPTPAPTPRTPAADGTPYSALSHLECPRCGRELDAHVLQGLCPCGSPLLVRYDLGGLVRAGYAPADLAGRGQDLWRYHEVLPVQSPQAVVTLGEGMTPLLPLPRVGERVGVRRLLVKDEGLLPTGSFKARGAAVGVSRAAELGATALSMPTNGNAGAAWAAYAARAGLPLHVAMPVDAPSVTRVEVTATGARLTLVDGHIGEAGAWLARHRPGGVTDVSTLKEPYRIEGKKTMALEVAEQLGWRMPDVVVYPTGGGVGLIGMHKAFHELRELGWVTGDVPRFVAVQSTGCAPVVEAFEAGAEQVRPWTAPRTVAFGITVPAPIGDRLVLHALRESGGTAVAVDDEELLGDLRLVGELEGLFASPEGAATVSAVRRLRGSGWLGEDDEVVVLNTGSGLVYPDTVPVSAPTVAPTS